MVLNPEIEEMILSAIRADPDKALTLPDHAYNVEGRVIVYVDGLPIDLARHLHNILIRPLGYHERMTDQSGVAGNVNPHLFTVRGDGKSGHLRCHKGHLYEGNEAPPNSRKIRCLICLKSHYNVGARKSFAAVNAAKTHCPHDHEYTRQNTIIEWRGKGKRRRKVRRCRTCTLARKREAMRRRRAAERKESE